MKKIFTGIRFCFFFCCLALIQFIPSEAANKHQTRIHFISLDGNTDAILLESNGHFGMVDSGEDSDYPKGTNPKYPLRREIDTTNGFEDKVIKYLKKAGVKRLDFYIGTHSHSDHIGSGDEILNAFKTKKLYLARYDDSNISNPNALWDNQYCYDNLISKAQKQGTKIIQNFEKNSNRIFTLGDMKIEIMNYRRRRDSKGNLIKQPDENNNSLGIKITAYGKTAFLAGDMNNAAPERDEMQAAKQLGRIDLLKMPHHGLAGSGTTAFLKKLSPSNVVVTGSLSNLSNAQKNILLKTGSAVYTTYNQPDNSAVIANFPKTANTLTMASPGNLTIKTKKSKKSKKSSFYSISGKRYTSKKGWFYYNQNYYYLTATGHLKRNSWIQSEGTWYYLNTNGEMATDATRIKNKAYAFYADGKLSAGGWTKGKKHTAYANSNGQAYTGLKKIGKHTYLFNSSGHMQKGLTKYKTHYYYFKPNGRMIKNTTIKLNGISYTFNQKGICTKITKPKTTHPETTQPETTQPETSPPETTQPETTQPETTQPETTQPETSPPETTQTETTQSESPQPKIAQIT